jgi:hypothetical protein
LLSGSRTVAGLYGTGSQSSADLRIAVRGLLLLASTFEGRRLDAEAIAAITDLAEPLRSALQALIGAVED